MEEIWKRAKKKHNVSNMLTISHSGLATIHSSTQTREGRPFKNSILSNKMPMAIFIVQLKKAWQHYWEKAQRFELKYH